MTRVGRGRSRVGWYFLSRLTDSLKIFLGLRGPGFSNFRLPISNSKGADCRSSLSKPASLQDNVRQVIRKRKVSFSGVKQYSITVVSSVEYVDSSKCGRGYREDIDDF